MKPIMTSMDKCSSQESEREIKTIFKVKNWFIVNSAEKEVKQDIVQLFSVPCLRVINQMW